MIKHSGFTKMGYSWHLDEQDALVLQGEREGQYMVLNLEDLVGIAEAIILQLKETH